MAWVKFIADFDYRCSWGTAAYKAGMVQNVTRDCATEAVDAGKAVRLKAPRKGEVPHEEA